MKNKKKVIIIVVVATVLVSLISGIAYTRGYFDLGIKACPSAWIDNQMPTIPPSRNTQYLIIDGTRRETSEYNLNWIRTNCEVNEPLVVY